MKYNISLTNDSLTVVFTECARIGGVQIKTINSSHPSWTPALKLISNRGDAEDLLDLMDVKIAINKFSHGHVTVTDAEVLYDGKPVYGFITDRILSFMSAGLPYQPIVKFLDRVKKNPSARSVEQLYGFLEHRSMPLTDTGTFLAYKSVRMDYMDHYTNTISNRIGEAPVRLNRNEVNDDANVGCSYGYHVGSLGYAQSFHTGCSRIMIVEVDPTDVVSVPYDCGCQKLRTTWYKVVGEFDKVLSDDYDSSYSSNDSTEDCTVEPMPEGDLYSEDDEYDSTDVDEYEEYDDEDDDNQDPVEEYYEMGHDDGFWDGWDLNSYYDDPCELEVPREYFAAYNEGYRDGYDAGEARYTKVEYDFED